MKIEKYGCLWPENAHPVEIERACIRKGGHWIAPGGSQCGAGLFQHYRTIQSLLWPEDDHHRWSDQMLNGLLEERLLVIFGARDSSKTRTVSKWALIDYWAFPHETLTLMTSTDARGLELRVWGDIKQLFTRARERYENLEGNVVDAKHGLFTDDIGGDDEARDIRKGIIGIPCLTSTGDFQGMSLKNFAGIKQKRRRLVGDECFPAGTLVETMEGLIPIEQIRPGDLVWGASGLEVVLVRSSRFAPDLVKVKFTDGKEISCTPDHFFLTQVGWKRACELNQQQYILSAYEALQILRQTNFQPSVLQSLLRAEFLASATSKTIKGCSAGHEEFVPGTRSFAPKTFEPEHEKEWALSQNSGRQRDGTDQGRVEIVEDNSRRDLELRNQDRKMERERDTSGVQSGCGDSAIEAGHRSGWFVPHFERQARERHQKRQFLKGSWVDSVTVQKQGHHGFSNTGEDSGGHRVYNLQVTGHPSYSVVGLCCHNCQFIPVEYLKILDAMDKGDFKAALLGNPIGGNGKCLDLASEPVAGWNSLGEVTKTTTWRNKYGGMTINLVGIDSPNFDPETKAKFPYLVDEQDAKRVAARPGGKKSLEWWSMIMGVRKLGVVSNRVLDSAMLEANGAFKDCIWSTEPTLKVYGVDAGYGGDLCVASYIEGGEEVGGRQVIKFHEQEVVPVEIGTAVTVEDQIANWCKRRCSERGVPDSNVFIEAGMRATLAVSFGRIMSPSINAINFGGTATQRPVSNDLFVFDEKTQQRRLKTCYEHYSKFVTELAFAVRAVVECGQARGFPRTAADEFEKREWRFIYGDRYELETKLEYKSRNSGESPNFSDSEMIAIEGARRLGFAIERLADEGSLARPGDDWLQMELRGHRQEGKKLELNYNA